MRLRLLNRADNTEKLRYSVAGGAILVMG